MRDSQSEHIIALKINTVQKVNDVVHEARLSYNSIIVSVEQVIKPAPLIELIWLFVASCIAHQLFLSDAT